MKSGYPIRRRPVFTIVALTLLMMLLDSTIVATVLPDLQQRLGTTVNWAVWTSLVTQFGDSARVDPGHFCATNRSVKLVSIIDLVGDERDTVPVGDLAQFDHQDARRFIEAALALYGFNDEGCDVVRIEIGLEKLVGTASG